MSLPVKRQKTVLVGRQSGLPVKVSKLNEYQVEFKSRFDELKALHGSEMLGLQKDLELLDQEMQKKYEIEEQWVLPKSFKAWRDLVDIHGPFLVTVNKHTGELILIIIDQEFGV
jgi:hypothetical protein